jgi:predicted HAD superfamily phosphohydrolase YqeG
VHNAPNDFILPFKEFYLRKIFYMTQAHSTSSDREGLTSAKLSRFLSLPFQPSRLTTYLAVKNFEEVPLDVLLRDGMQGVLLDADGTLGPHHTRDFDIAVIDHVKKLLQMGLKVAIYTNASDDRFQPFEILGVKIVKNVPPKPDRAGFEIAMKEFLGLHDPSKICMIGDNYITDGGAIDAGMCFIYTQPVNGNEAIIHRLTRYLAYLCACLHGKIPQERPL